MIRATVSGEANGGSPLLLAKGVGKTVDNGDAPLVLLDQVDLCIAQGETLAIVGASGAGKSTLLGLLAGLDEASTGEIFLAGQLLGTLNEDQRAQLRAQVLGFVFQSFQLLPALTALENVMLPLELLGQSTSVAKLTASHWLTEVGLNHRLTHLPKHLSGGEQQRVALARAFAPQPKLILADEPTGNLDAETGQKIMDLMFSLNEKAGTTLVLVTHDEVLAGRCQRVFRLLPPVRQD